MNFADFTWTTLLYISIFTGCYVYFVWSLPWRVPRSAGIALLAALLALTYVRRDSSLQILATRYSVFCAIYILWSLVCLRIQRNYAVYLAVFITILMGIWVSCVELTLFFFHIQDRTLLTAIAGVCRILSVVIIRRCAIRIDESRTISLHQMALSLFPALACFAANLEVYEILELMTKAGENGNMLAVRLSVYFFGVAALVVLLSSESYFTLAQYRSERERALNQLQAQYDLFVREKAADERLRALHHDMKNHLSTLEAMSESEGVRTYIANLRAAEEQASRPFHTGNATLDALLLTKQDVLRQNGIKLICLVHFRDIDFLSPMDLCTLFSNGLDNAIEAVIAANLPESERVIRLSGGEVHGNVVARIQNPYRASLIPSHGLLRTTKQDAELHGYGMKNMKDILDAHNGSMTYKADQDVFTLFWSIPLPQS